ncbi:MAG TPA: hypothetical protein VFB16_11200 [Bauldia sp.]|nr:hypothetical protein [Bauldia sp.]
MIGRSWFALAVLVAVTTASQADDALENGMDAWRRADFETAMRLLAPLAEQGNAKAEYMVGLMYANAQGRPEDVQKGNVWFEKAAAHGIVDARYSLCQNYAVGGVGTPVDSARAYTWCVVAVTGYDQAGDTEAKSNAAAFRDLVAKKLTPAELADAKQKSEEWLAAH